MTDQRIPDTTNGAGDRHLDLSFLDVYEGDDELAWRSRARVVLSPIAAPSILGLFGFMVATVMVGAWQAGWYGNADTGLTLFPFAMMFGGIAQFAACLFSFRARDGVAVAVHGAWGSFWIGWGVLQLLVATHVLAPIVFGQSSPAFAFWFIALALVTGSVALAGLAQNLGVFFVTGVLAVGSGFTAAGFWAGSVTTLEIGGWLFVISAMLAWLVATAMMLESAFGRTIIPLGTWSKAGNVPLRKPTRPVQYPAGMPGVKVGQ
jgi:succinate-acetate transporter protein